MNDKPLTRDGIEFVLGMTLYRADGMPYAVETSKKTHSIFKGDYGFILVSLKPIAFRSYQHRYLSGYYGSLENCCNDKIADIFNEVDNLNFLADDIAELRPELMDKRSL